jgi:hypothetical protein
MQQIITDEEKWESKQKRVNHKNCVNYKIKLKQSNCERNGKTILCFEHFLSQKKPNCLLIDDLRFRKIFNLGTTKDIFGKKLSKLEKLQSLVAKCCKIRKI